MIPYFIKTASYDSKLKKLPFLYYSLGEAYEKGPYSKQSADYKAKYENKDETPESKLALENINQVIDRMIDAYARAVALAGSDSQYAAIKTQGMNAVSDWYKFRHNKSDAGLNEMIAGVLSTPLPPEPTPLTSLPTPPATPASGVGTTPATSSPSPQPAPTKNTAASTTTKPPTAPKPKLHRAHSPR